MRALIVMLVLVPAVARAELDVKGVRFGAGFASLSKSRDQQEAIIAQPGIVLGAYLGWRFSPSFVLQVEGLVADRPQKTELCMMEQCVTLSKISLWYLDVPLVLRFDAVPRRFHIDAGPVFSLALGGGGRDEMTGEFRRFPDLEPFNVGGFLGVGIEFAGGPGQVTIDVRYQRWLLDVTGSVDLTNPQPGLGDGQSDVGSSHQLMLVAGYAFP